MSNLLRKDFGMMAPQQPSLKQKRKTLALDYGVDGKFVLFFLKQENRLDGFLNIWSSVCRRMPAAEVFPEELE